MAVKIFLDPGHGGSDPGAVNGNYQEKDFTLDIGLECRRVLLEEYEGVEVKMSRTKDTTVSLSARTHEANRWGADYYLSIHINAGGGRGFESYIYNGRVSDFTKVAQDRIHSVIAAGDGWPDRGQKRANFHVLRETEMSALLTENGFIDSSDLNKLKDPDFRKKLGRLHAEGIAKAFGLRKKSKPAPKPDPEPSGGVWIVQTGAFKDKDNAEERAKLIKEKTGLDSYIWLKK